MPYKRAEYQRAQNERYRAKNREKIAALNKQYVAVHRDCVRAHARKSQNRRTDLLLDGYIKQLLSNWRAPDDLIEAKRAQVKLLRMLRS
jgi:hypothetical protein